MLLSLRYHNVSKWNFILGAQSRQRQYGITYHHDMPPEITPDLQAQNYSPQTVSLFSNHAIIVEERQPRLRPPQEDR